MQQLKKTTHTCMAALRNIYDWYVDIRSASKGKVESDDVQIRTELSTVGNENRDCEVSREG